MKCLLLILIASLHSLAAFELIETNRADAALELLEENARLVVDLNTTVFQAKHSIYPLWKRAQVESIGKKPKSLISIMNNDEAANLGLGQKEATEMQYLYKIVSKQAWERSLLAGTLELAPIDKEFIHLATEEQLERVEKKFWPDQDHVILKVEAKGMSGRLVHESNPGGSTKYYHLYDGNIPLEAVKEVIIRENQ